jgi:hypothetical protein
MNRLKQTRRILIFILSGISLSVFLSSFHEKEKIENKYNLDIRPFGELRYWSEQTGVPGKIPEESKLIVVPQTSSSDWNIGLNWEEERDIDRIEIDYEGKIPEIIAKETKIQYWFNTWPREAPKDHKIEDHLDDPWQGEWLTAATDYRINGNKVVYSFNPLTEKENPLAIHLQKPVDYRRTLKFRLLYNRKPLNIKSLRVYTPTKCKNISVRIELGCNKPVNKTITGKLEIFNGKIEKISGWQWTAGDKPAEKNSWIFHLKNQPKGILADLVVAEPTLGGSTDLTIVTVRSSEGTFSFLTDDLKKGPVYIPSYSAYITLASDTAKFSEAAIKKGQTVREKLKVEPEQTYDRACREIPELSVMKREQGGVLYLPLAADASWQKFGFDWGGNFYMDKYLTRAKGRELERCLWDGEKFNWLIGTGREPVYVRDDKNSHMSVLNDYLPVPEVTWAQEGLLYHEEAFVTLLEGPLSPYDIVRSEQTPAILMVSLNVSNPSNTEKSTHIWLKGKPIDKLLLDDLFIMDEKNGKAYIRAEIKLPEDVPFSEVKSIDDAVHMSFVVPANETKTVFFSIPFVGDLSENGKPKIKSLDYHQERQRVVSYWRDIVNECVPFHVPERKFNEMGQSAIPHIRMSATKDPKSGLFMVFAAAFKHPVFGNEAAFQTVYLDKIGDHQTAASYLETFLKLQGRVPMPGTFTGDQSGVLNGAKVDEEYDYSSSAYNMHHGTILWALGEHSLLSHDSGWLNHAAPNMVKAADWIISQRNQTKLTDKNGMPVQHYGLLPAGHLEDNFDWGFWYAVNAYSYLGLKTTAEAFAKANLPEAARLGKEANDYLNDIRNSVRRASELSPVVLLKNNTYVPFIPSRAYQRFRYFGPMQSGYYSRNGENTLITYRLSATREALYGPMILITTGIVDPFEPLAEAILDDWEDNITLTSSLGQHIHGVVDDEYWFSRGGMVFQANLQNPILSYILRNEIPAAIRGVYNAMVSCLYRDVNVFTEEYRRWGVGSGRLYKVPDEARFLNRVCDLLAIESGDELWLAAGTPGYWLEPGKIITLYKSASRYGNVSFEMKNGKKPGTIEATINLPENIPEGKVKLFVRAPFGKSMQSVYVNGKIWNNWDTNKDVIVLPSSEHKINLLVSY